MVATSLASATELIDGSSASPASPPGHVGHRSPRKRRLTAHQLTAIAHVMQLFVEDDLALGVSPDASIRCPACERKRPRPGAISYGRYFICTGCATEFEVARASRGPLSIGQYIRDKQYGESERYALPPALHQGPP